MPNPGLVFVATTSALSTLTSCTGPFEPPPEGADRRSGALSSVGTQCVDADADGYCYGEGDCDDADPNMFPVTFEDLAGNRFDHTPCFAAGTLQSPTACAINDFGTLTICPGTWYAQARVYEDLRPANPGEYIVIQGHPSGPRPVLHGAGKQKPLWTAPHFGATQWNTTIRGIIVRNGFDKEGWGGGGLLAEGGTTVENCTFVDNYTAEQGGAIAFNSGNDGFTNIVDCTFIDNEAAAPDQSRHGGGAIYGDLLTLRVSGSRFERNRASYGAAVAVDEGNITVTDSSFHENDSQDDGGAIYVQRGRAVFSYVDVEDSVFRANTAHQGGAVYAGQVPLVRLSDSIFLDNEAQMRGGALAVVDGAEVNVVRSSFGRNTALLGSAASVTSQRLACDASNWGHGQLDNPRDDLEFGGRRYELGNNETFVLP